MGSAGAPRIVVLGDVVTDVVVRVAGPPARGSDTGATIRTGTGGAGANLAAWLAADGADVTLVARVGDDAAGRQRSAALRRAGVRPRLATDPERPTGTVVVLVQGAGGDGASAGAAERTMLTDRGASAWLDAADLCEADLDDADHLHLSGYVLLGEWSRPAGLRALDLARERGVATSVGASSTVPLVTAGPQRFFDWTGGATCCLANLDEGRALTGADEPAAVVSRLAGRYGEAVVTLGQGGAVWAAAGAPVARVPAARVAVVDPTGAGDAFAAGFLAARVAAASGVDALRAGARLAAEAVAIAGAQPASSREPVRATSGRHADAGSQ